MFDWGVQKVSIFFLSPKIMLSRPIRKSIPMAKLTADNVGDIELTSHHRAIASNQAQVAQPETRPHPLHLLLIPWIQHRLQQHWKFLTLQPQLSSLKLDL
jgi:hypothetical protein